MFFLKRAHSHPREKKNKNQGVDLEKSSGGVFVCLFCPCAYLPSHHLVIATKHQMANVLVCNNESKQKQRKEKQAVEYLTDRSKLNPKR